MNNEDINVEKFQAGIDKRRKQKEDLEKWIETHDEYRLQMNFCIPGSPEHTCITISGCKAPELARIAISYLDKQIASMSKRIIEITKK